MTSGCDCSWGGEIQSSWTEVADHYNRNAGANDAKQRYEKYPLFGNVIKEMNDRWEIEKPHWLNVVV